MDATYEPKALYYYVKRFFSKLLIAVISELEKVKAGTPLQLQSISVIAINDTSEHLTATLNCRLIDLFGHLLDQVVFPVAIGPFSTSAQLKLPKAIISPAEPHKSCLHLIMDKNSEKIAENLFFYLPDKYVDWPKVQITRNLSRITDTYACATCGEANTGAGRKPKGSVLCAKWMLKLKSNAIAKDVQISTTVPAPLETQRRKFLTGPAQFSDNFIDLIPPDEPLIIIDCEQPVSSIESVLQLRSLKSMFRATAGSALTSHTRKPTNTVLPPSTFL